MKADTRRDRAVADDYLGNHVPCRCCKAMTEREELSRFGGRCRSCHDRHLAEAAPAGQPPMSNRELIQRAVQKLQAIGKGRADPLGWAKRLRDRELNHGGKLPDGRNMTPVQSEMWRSVLGETA